MTNVDDRPDAFPYRLKVSFIVSQIWVCHLFEVENRDFLLGLGPLASPGNFTVS